MVSIPEQLKIIARPAKRRFFQGSANYWETRYAAEGNSGAGSYGPTAEFKAQVLNTFVDEHAIQTVIEFGSGDGNQVSLANYPTYVGLDVSPTAIRLCQQRFADDTTKSFIAYDPSAFVNNGALRADLALSLDVLMHLVEDNVFETYMRHLFQASNRHVAIFSANEDRTAGFAAHVRYRRFSDWVTINRPEWHLYREVENPGKGEDSGADFYFYARR